MDKFLEGLFGSGSLLPGAWDRRTRWVRACPGGMGSTHVLEAPVEGLQLLLGELGLCLQLVQSLRLVAHCGQLQLTVAAIWKGTQTQGGWNKCPCSSSSSSVGTRPCAKVGVEGSPYVTTMYVPAGCALHKWSGYDGMTYTQRSCALWLLCCFAPHAE